MKIGVVVGLIILLLSLVSISGSSQPEIREDWIGVNFGDRYEFLILEATGTQGFGFWNFNPGETPWDTKETYYIPVGDTFSIYFNTSTSNIHHANPRWLEFDIEHGDEVIHSASVQLDTRDPSGILVFNTNWEENIEWWIQRKQQYDSDRTTSYSISMAIINTSSLFGFIRNEAYPNGWFQSVEHVFEKETGVIAYTNLLRVENGTVTKHYSLEQTNFERNYIHDFAEIREDEVSKNGSMAVEQSTYILTGIIISLLVRVSRRVLPRE